MEVGEEGDYIYRSLHYHHQNDSSIKMGSDESYLNVSLSVRDKVTRQCRQQATNFFKRRDSRSGMEPRPFCLPAQRLTARPHQITDNASNHGLIYIYVHALIPPESRFGLAVRR